MSFYINEALFFDFYLNGNKIQLGLDNINSMVITSNIYDLIPGIRIEVKDTHNVFAQGLLSDGSVLSVAVGNNSENALQNLMDFVLVGIPDEQRVTNNSTYLIYGVLDIPGFWKGSEPISFTGTSSLALQNLAGMHGLIYDGIATLDSMTWFNGTMSYATFAKHITDHGYINSRSCMKSVILPNKTFLYRDINNLPTPKYTLTNLTDNKPETLVFREILFQNKGGLYNYSYGYKTQFTEFSIEKSTASFYDIVFAKINSAVLNINQDKYMQAGLIRNDFMPLNAGNVHENYTKAYYQNMRNSALNSIKAELYFTERTPLQVLDKVNFSMLNPQTKEPDSNLASQWVVEAKTIGISQASYVEKIVLSTTGTQLDLFNNLV